MRGWGYIRLLVEDVWVFIVGEIRMVYMWEIYDCILVVNFLWFFWKFIENDEVMFLVVWDGGGIVMEFVFIDILGVGFMKGYYVRFLVGGFVYEELLIFML